jgi:hypothetical protein
MNGKLYLINPKRGMVAVLTENGDFTIIQIIGSYEIDIGDELTWKNDTGLGSERYRNITKNQIIEVFVQNHWVNKSQLQQQLLLE